MQQNNPQSTELKWLIRNWLRLSKKHSPPPTPGPFPPPPPLSLPGLLNTQPRSRLMYEQQGRKDNVEATAQLDSVQTAPLQPAPPADLDLIFRHHSTVFRAAYRVTGNASDAEDVLQTVFMRLLRRPPGRRSRWQHGRLSAASSRKRGAGPDPLPAGRAACPPR